MPSLFDPAYAHLICALPVQQHHVSVNAAFWRPRFLAADQEAIWEAIFGPEANVAISRHRLHHFAYPSQEQKCAEILLWGYPNDMRGIVSRLLPQLVAVSHTAAAVLPWPGYFDAFPLGCGISTITKFACFFGHTFAGHPALILDNRLIENTSRWVETADLGLSYGNAPANYLDYLATMHATAANPALACTAEQLEFFLFALGDSF